MILVSLARDTVSIVLIMERVTFYFCFIVILSNCCCNEGSTLYRDNRYANSIDSSPNLDIFNHSLIVDDALWFVKKLTNMAEFIDGILPNDTEVTNGETKSLRILFLSGLRHLVLGIKDISLTFIHNIDDDKAKQFPQLRSSTNIIRTLSDTLSNFMHVLRSIFEEIFSLFNFYLPELTMCKCVAYSIRKTYPNADYVEYPLLLLGEITSSIKRILNAELFPQESINDVGYGEYEMGETEDNEILHNDETNEMGAMDTIESVRAKNDTSWTLLVKSNKEWHDCLNAYVMEVVIRHMRLFFSS